MLEVLQNTHSLDLSCATMNISFLQLLCISLQSVDIVGKDDDLVSSGLMIVDQELAGLILVGIHAIQ